MASVTFNKAYTDLPLTQMSLAYMNELDGFLADKLFPNVMVNKDSGDIYSYGKQALRIVDTERATRGEYNSIDFSVEKSDHYILKDHGLSGYVYQEDLDAEDPVSAETDETQILVQKMMLDKEQRALSQLNSTTFSGYATQLSGTDLFSDLDNSSPFKVIETAINSIRTKSGKLPNSMIISYDVYSVLKYHPKILARFPGTGIITKAMVSDAMGALFGIQNVYVSVSQYTNTNLGDSTEAISDLLSKKIFLYYSEEPRLKSLSFGKTYTRNPGLQVSKYNAQQLGESAIKRKVASMILTQHKYDQVIVAKDCAHLIYDVIA